MSKLTDSVKVVPNRRARVQLSLSLMKLQMADSLGGTANIPRPIVGGNTTGLHYQPQPYDEVIALAEVNGWHSTAVSAVTTNTTLPNYLPLLGMNPGETAIFGADGRQVAYVRSDGSTYLYNRSTGAQIIVTSTQNIQLSTPTGGSISVSAGATGTIQITGLSTFQQLATYQGGLTATGAVNINTTGTGQATNIGNANNPIDLAGLTTIGDGLTTNGTNKLTGILIGSVTIPGSTTVAPTNSTAISVSGTIPSMTVSGSVSNTAEVPYNTVGANFVGTFMSGAQYAATAATSNITSTLMPVGTLTTPSTGVSGWPGSGGNALIFVYTTTLTITGAAVGDFCIPSLSSALPSYAVMEAAVTAANTVTLSIFNLSETTVLTLSGLTARVLVLQAA